MTYAGHELVKLTGNSDFATGMIIPKSTPTAINYLNELREFNDAQADIKKQIQLSNKLYLWEGVVSTVIDVLSEFATTPLIINNVKNPKAKKIVEFFVSEVNRDNNSSMKGFAPLIRQIILDWFISGNVFPYQVWSDVRDKKISDTKKVYMPMSIYLMNPLNIEIPEGCVEFGKKLLLFKISDKVMRALSSSSSQDSIEIRELRKLIPKELKKKITSDGYVVLDERYVTHLMRKNRDYMPWGIPYLTKAFSAIAFKRKLKALDEATTDGLINQVTIFKIGDKNNPKTWSPSRISTFARLLSAPTPTMTLVWSYDIDVLQTGPSENIINFKDKYVQANLDILNSLGVPLTLIAGAGTGSQGGESAFVQIMSLLERLDEVRDIVKTYLDKTLRSIMIANGFQDEYPEIQFKNMRLKNEKEVKNLVLAFYDRGLLSIKTALEEAGYDFEKETLVREKENKDNLEETYQRRDLPFGTPKEGGRPTDKVNTKVKSKTKTFNKTENNNSPPKKESAMWNEYSNKFFDDLAEEISDASDSDDVKLIMMPKIVQLENCVYVLSDEAKEKPELMNQFRKEELKMIDNVVRDFEDLDKGKSIGELNEEVRNIIERHSEDIVSFGLEMIGGKTDASTNK